MKSLKTKDKMEETTFMLWVLMLHQNQEGTLELLW